MKECCVGCALGAFFLELAQRTSHVGNPVLDALNHSRPSRPLLLLSQHQLAQFSFIVASLQSVKPHHRLKHEAPSTPLLYLCPHSRFLYPSTSAVQWDKDDQEIFQLQSALEKSEGKGANFYTILAIPRTSSSAEIKRAYRKKSLELHPDKNAGVAGAQQRFERLGLVYKILRDGRKDRYDHFLSKGFPKWRTTVTSMSVTDLVLAL